MLAIPATAFFAALAAFLVMRFSMQARLDMDSALDTMLGDPPKWVLRATALMIACCVAMFLSVAAFAIMLALRLG